MEDAFAVGNTPLTGSSACMCPAQPGKPAVERAHSPCKSAGRSIFGCGRLSARDLFG